MLRLSEPRLRTFFRQSTSWKLKSSHIINEDEGGVHISAPIHSSLRSEYTTNALIFAKNVYLEVPMSALIGFQQQMIL